MWYFGSVIVALGLMGYSDCKPQPTIEIDQTGADLSDQEFLSIFDTPNDVTGLSPASTITSDESVTTPHPPHTVCGSYNAVKHLIVEDKISNSPSPLLEMGATASLHDSSTNFSSATQRCGGVLISDRYLLTAAHCMSQNSVKLISITLGRKDLNENIESPINTYVIANYTLHPEYKPSSGDYHDLALLKTDRKVEFSETIWPICLPDRNQVFEHNTLLQISGYGQVSGGAKSSSLLTAFIRLVSNNRCEDKWKQLAPGSYKSIKKNTYPNGFIPEIICAIRPGVSSCEGDSGGPLSYEDKNHISSVVGIVSKGLGNCPSFPITPAFYTNIRLYLDWIYNVTGLSPASTITSDESVTTPHPPHTDITGLSPASTITSNESVTTPHPPHTDHDLCVFLDSTKDCEDPSIKEDCPILCTIENDPDICKKFNMSTHCSIDTIAKKCTNLCSVATCGSLSCPSNGRCTEGSGTREATCACNNGYRSQGSRCIVDCNPTCQRGTCNGSNQCSCTTSWSRERCNKEFYGAASAGELSFIKGELSTGSSSGLRLNWRNKDYYGFTALHIATYKDKLTVVRALLDAGANIDMKVGVNGLTPVFIAASLGHTAVLRTLLEPKYRADVNLPENNGVTPVYIAAEKGQTAALELLIAHGGDVNRVTNAGSSPLVIASEYGHVGAVRALLNAGANVGYAHHSDGLTALHFAAWKNHADVARLLLQNSAIKNKQGNNGDTPADMSRKLGDGSLAGIIDNY